MAHRAPPPISRDAKFPNSPSLGRTQTAALDPSSRGTWNKDTIESMTLQECRGCEDCVGDMRVLLVSLSAGQHPLVVVLFFFLALVRIQLTLYGLLSPRLKHVR